MFSCGQKCSQTNEKEKRKKGVWEILHPRPQYVGYARRGIGNEIFFILFFCVFPFSPPPHCYINPPPINTLPRQQRFFFFFSGPLFGFILREKGGEKEKLKVQIHSPFNGRCKHRKEKKKDNF